MDRHVIKTYPNGQELYVDLMSSSAGQYLSRQPYVLGLIEELAGAINLKAERIALEKDMGRIIGNTDILDTTEKDTIYYAKATKGTVFSRFARNRSPARSSILTVILERDADGNYALVDTWIGPYCPPFPGDDHEAENSKSYWQTHALVQDAQVIQSKTITKICPY